MTGVNNTFRFSRRTIPFQSEKLAINSLQQLNPARMLKPFNADNVTVGPGAGLWGPW
jgi:hypothetical protein